MVAVHRGLTHRSKNCLGTPGSLWLSAISPATILPKGVLKAPIKLRTRTAETLPPSSPTGSPGWGPLEGAQAGLSWHKVYFRHKRWSYSVVIEHFVRVAQKRLPLGPELQIALNLIPAHTWYAVPLGALTFVSERAADYLGLAKDHPLRFGTVTGADWDSHIPLLHPDDREETRRVWSDSLRTGCAGEVSFRVRNTEGGYRWFLSRAEPVRATDGTLLYWIGVNLDIDERKQSEFYLAEGQRLAHTGSWAFTPAGFEYWSSELFQIHGLDPRG